jgi:hypothetical protein
MQRSRQSLSQSGFDLAVVHGSCQVCEARDGKARIAAGVDPLERLHVQIQVQRNAVVAAAAPDPEANRGDLGAIDIDTGRIRAGRCKDAVVGQQIDHGPFEQVHQGLDADAHPWKLQQQIGDELSRTVVSDLSAAVGLHHRDVSGRKQMLVTSRLAEREHRRMLQQPELIGCLGTALVREPSHRLPGGCVVSSAQTSNEEPLRAIRATRRAHWNAAKGFADPPRPVPETVERRLKGIDDQLVVGQVLVDGVKLRLAFGLDDRGDGEPFSAPALAYGD